MTTAEPYREITRPPTDRLVVANGLELHYLDWGGSGQPDVLLLHGAALTAHTWDTVCDLLRDTYHCLALDLRGHGDSAWASDHGSYDPADFEADLEQAVRQLGLDQFVLIGMSMGGGIALGYAGTHAHKLSSLVVVDTGPRPARVREAHAQGAGRIRQFVAEDRELESFEAFVDRALAFNPRRSREQLRKSLQFSLRQTPSGTWTWKSDPRLTLRPPGQSAARNEQLWAAARSFDKPALVVRGGESELFSDQDAQGLAEALPRGSWVRIDGAGHTVQGDRPHALARELRAFLDPLRPPLPV
ncbi:MAG: alpha/beta hydrolase [Chloroflexi bacterium]|nr:alpha/beta hydrolase [Chloroflexota bacterium]